jgi:hypothetical protein
VPPVLPRTSTRRVALQLRLRADVGLGSGPTKLTMIITGLLSDGWPTESLAIGLSRQLPSRLANASGTPRTKRRRRRSSIERRGHFDIRLEQIGDRARTGVGGILMLLPFSMMSAKSRSKISRAPERESAGYEPILDFVRRPARHCCAIHSAVTRVGIGFRMSTGRPVPRPSPSARDICWRDLATRLMARRMALSVRLGMVIFVVRLKGAVRGLQQGTVSPPNFQNGA